MIVLMMIVACRAWKGLGDVVFTWHGKLAVVFLAYGAMECFGHAMFVTSGSHDSPTTGWLGKPRHM
jgi:hypothetical protein